MSRNASARFAAISRRSPALPRLPAEVERAIGILLLEFEERGLLSVLLPILGFGVLGFGAEWLYRRLTAGVRQWIGAIPLETVNGRLHAVIARFAFGLGMVASFALGSTGAFMAFDWPILLKEIVLVYLLAVLATRFAMVLGRFLFALPSALMFANVKRFRIVPMSNRAAVF